jgi:NAD(P)-dependent dehydrogenase (short-subunit alcohol dehydrogenase family)
MNQTIGRSQMSTEGMLSGKSALVTGASSGIGAAIATEMAGAGAQVAISGRDERRLTATADAIEQAGSTAVVIAGDLTSDDGPARTVAQAAEAMGGLDVMANVAGVMELAPIEETPIEALDRQYVANLRVPYLLTQAALPHLRQSRGAMIFISSMAALAAFPDSSAYSATKGAIDSLSRQLAVELAEDGIRINAIAPGEIDTPMNAEYYAENPEFVDEVKRFTPAGRLGTPDDIAPAAVFLASDAARFIYGVTLAVDGGQLAR